MSARLLDCPQCGAPDACRRLAPRFLCLTMQTRLAPHTLLELRGCDSALLNKPAELKLLLLEAVRRGHGTIVTEVFHTFNPHGVSGVVVIAESHVAIHTWPEHDYAAVDIFACSTTLDHLAIRDWIRSGLGASSVESRELTRG